jgi:hypothetical protein
VTGADELNEAFEKKRRIHSNCHTVEEEEQKEEE